MASKIFKLLELKEKFLQSSDLLEADSLDRQSGFVALPSSNRIDFICIKSTKVDSSRLELDRLAITLPNSDICSLTWNKSFTGNESDGIRALLALSQKTGNVSIFKMMYSSTACSTELHRLTLKGLIREHNQSIDVSVNECEVLNFSSDLLTVLVDKLLIIQLRVHETKPWQIVYTIPCPHQVISATVTGAVIALLDSDHSTLLYDLKTSSFLAVIQRQKEKHWVSCRLTPNYLHMIYQNDTGQLFCCNLDLYFHQNPLLLIRDESPSPCSGDESQPTHWYHKLKFSDSQVSSEKKQYPNLQTFIKIPLSGDCLYYQCTSGYVSAYCLSKGSTKVSSYSIDSQHVEELPVDARQHVVLSNIDTIPHLLISDSFVLAAMIGHSHKFYTERDTKSGLLDTIALQNGWCKQTSSYNIQNLKRALEIRKVDYVLEHIRTKSSFMEDIMRSPPIDNRTELKQMVDMIHTAVSTYMAHSTTRVFAQQVTEAMVTFFKEQERRGIAILNDMLMANNTEKKGLMESLLEKLFDYKTSFTDLLQGSKSKKPGSDVTPTKAKSRDSPKRSARTSKKLLSLLNEDLVKKWNSLSSKELIEDGILMGDISKLQTYFTLNHREAEASWDVIVRTGLECVLDELAARNWSTVCQILKNLGFGVFTKLSQIAVYTTDTSLRRYLVKQLKMEGEFTESENQAIQFSTEFDELHPCQSFQLALEESRKCADFSASDTFMIRKLCGEVGVIPPAAELVRSKWYSHYMLDWMNHFLSHRDEIIIDRYIHETDSKSEAELCNVSSLTLWTYLCRHNMIDVLLHWINVQGHGAEATRTFQKQPITTCMIDVCNSMLPLHNQIIAQRRLASCGLLDSNALSSKKSLFTSLCKSGHILRREQCEGLLSLQQLVSHCLETGLLGLLYQFFALWSVSDEEVKGLDTHLSTKDYLLVLMLYSFYKISLQTQPDSKSMLDASLTSSQYLARNPYIEISEQLDHQLTDVALCNIMYHSPLLEGSKVQLSADQLTRCSDHPLLRHMLDTADSKHHDPPVITMYKLIEKWGALHGNNLFKTQIIGDGSSSEIPHFGNQALAEKYGLQEKLTFMYYLKQARPSFAFVVFLSDEMSQSNGTTIAATRLKLIVGQVHFLAVKYYENPEIAASCVAFLELMGENTELLCLLINAAHILHKGKLLRNLTADAAETHQNVELLLLPLVFGRKRMVRETYDELVLSAAAYIETIVDSSCSIEAGLKWRPVVAFSRQFQLPPPTNFLEACALSNNWLSFLVYSQIFGYEPWQLLSAVNMFTKDSIREHLQCVLDTNSGSHVNPDSGYSSTRLDTGEQFQHAMSIPVSSKPLSKLSLVSSSEDETKRSDKNTFSTELAVAAENDYVIPPYQANSSIISVEHIPNDVFAVLFMTSSQSGSWRLLNMYAALLGNPVLAVLAACHSGADSLECLSSWLIGWLDGKDKMAAEYMEPHSGRYLSRHAAVGVISLAVEKYNKLQLVKTGLRIFMRNCCLISLLNAIEELSQQQFFIVSTSLNQFKSSMKKIALSGSIEENTLTFTQLVDLSVLIIQSCIQHVNSFLCERFLHLLDEANLFTIFENKRVNFSYAYKVYKVAYDLHLPAVDRSKLISYQHIDELKYVIQLLENRKEFNKARQLSLSCDLDPGLVTVQELISDVQHMKAQPLWSLHEDHSSFWKQCYDKCVKYDVEAEKCSTYFETQATLSSSLPDKIKLGEYALKWMKQAPTAFESNNLHRLQKLVWQSQIDYLLSKKDSVDETTPSESSGRPSVSVSIDKTQFLLSQYKYEDFLKLLEKRDDSSTSSKEVDVAVQKLIGQLLDEFQVDEACQVSMEYGCATQDLVVVLVCMGMAMKLLDPANLDEKVKSLYAMQSPVKRRSASLSQSYLLTVSSVENYFPAREDDSPFQSDENLVYMRKLSGKCRHGVMPCEKIVSCYAIALALKQSYREVMLQSEYSLLKQLLNSNLSSRFELALEYINTCSLSDSDIASFLASNVTNSLRALAGLDDKMDVTTDSTPVVVEECMKAGKEYKQLIQLFVDQTIFGESLLEQATTISIDDSDVKLKLVVKLELLILSHDAYSCAYDMEGISRVLRACRTCAAQIAEVSHYPLMVHMLIEIGRFSEMTYIFDTLKQNHQFELLFRKGMPKDSKLKLAVLDYLRRFCPGDSDIYRVVSSHFAMYREIAQLLEQSALKKLRKLKPSTMKHTDQLSSQLTDIQKNLTDAAEIYIEGQCLRHAQSCIKQARLVFLQHSLVSSGVHVINLEPADVKSFIEHHDKFYETYTVSDAYNKNFWAAALCNNVLIRGDLKFLSEFSKTLPLTSSLITEVVQRFQLRTDVTRTSHMNSHLKKLLFYCKDVVSKYKLAQSLGLIELTKELLTADNGQLGAAIRDSVL